MTRLLLFSALVFLTIHPTDGHSCNGCIQINVIDCVSGEMRVEEQIKGHIRVSQLSVGDVIRGITGTDRTPAWCKVQAVYPVPRNRTTYNGFTASHMVIDSTVHYYGIRENEEVRVGPVYTLATDCDASVNSDGQAFTPISNAFCQHELSWNEYLTLIAAIRRVANRTGYFWFDLNAYHDNETAKVPRWGDQLPIVCRELLMCAREGRCQEFETFMEGFVHKYLDKKYVEVIERMFPNMGADVSKEQAGTISELVHPKHNSNNDHLVLFSTLGCSLLVLMIIAVAVLIYRRRMTKKIAEKELEPKKTGEVPA